MATFNQLPSGRWRAQVRLKGKIASESFLLKVDAQKWARKAEGRVGSSSITAKPAEELLRMTRMPALASQWRQAAMMRLD